MGKYVSDKDMGLKRFVQEMQTAKTAFVTIGVHQGERNADGTDIAEYAAANEYGTDDIPSRPFMRTSFDENVSVISDDIAKGMETVKLGGTVYRELSLIGDKQANRLQDTIAKRDFLPALKPATVKRKHGSTKTLIDHGAAGGMLGAIRYVLHK